MATSRAAEESKAYKHLCEIRKRKGVDDLDGENNDNVGDLNRALNMYYYFASSREREHILNEIDFQTSFIRNRPIFFWN